MAETYAEHADICAKFYQLTLDSPSVVQFIKAHSHIQPEYNVLFVGGMFDLANGLSKEGITLTVVDYSDEMVAIGRKLLPSARVEKADLRSLPFKEEFDLVLVVGRVFTHMITDEDLNAGLRSCRNSLKPGGRLFFDNYEDSKIQKTNYFNGEVVCSAADIEIRRLSSTTLLSKIPYVVRWDARYTGTIEENHFDFSDSMEHRAWSRTEIVPYLKDTGFEVIDQGDNFDETSFFTLAKAI